MAILDRAYIYFTIITNRTANDSRNDSKYFHEMLPMQHVETLFILRNILTLNQNKMQAVF